MSKKLLSTLNIALSFVAFFKIEFGRLGCPIINSASWISSNFITYDSQKVIADYGTRYTLKSLENSKVLIIGAGGLGSPIAIYLAALGVGNIGIVDKDKVEISNLNRQIIFENKDIRKKKSTIAALKIKKMPSPIKTTGFINRHTSLVY